MSWLKLFGNKIRGKDVVNKNGQNIDDLSFSNGWKQLVENVYYTKVGNVVHLRCTSSSKNPVVTKSSNTYTILATLPKGYRPEENVQFAVPVPGGTSANGSAGIVYPDGRLGIINTVESTQFYAFYITYITAA